MIAGEPLASEHVEIRADGLEALKNDLDKLRGNLKTLEDAAKGPGFREWFIEKIGLSKRLAEQQAQLVKVEASLYATAPYQKNLNAQAGLGVANRQAEIARKNAEAGYLSGDQGQAILRQHIALTKEYADAQKKVDYARLVAEHGKFGAAVLELQGKLSKAAGMAETVAGGAVGLARSGIHQGLGVLRSGVGMARMGAPASAMQLDYAFRDLTAVVGAGFRPVLEALTPIVRSVADAFLNSGMVEAIQRVSGKLADLFSSVANMAPRIFEALVPVVDAFGRLVDAMVPVINDLMPSFESLVKVVAGVAAGLVNALATFAGMTDTVVWAIKTTLIAALLPRLITGFQLLLSAAHGLTAGLTAAQGAAIRQTVGMFAVAAATTTLFDALVNAEAIRDRQATEGEAGDTGGGLVHLWRLITNLGDTDAMMEEDRDRAIAVRERRAQAEADRERRLRSAFGMGGGGQVSVGNIQSGFMAAMTAGLQNPAQQTADNTRRAADALERMERNRNDLRADDAGIAFGEGVGGGDW